MMISGYVLGSETGCHDNKWLQHLSMTRADPALTTRSVVISPLDIAVV